MTSQNPGCFAAIFGIRAKPKTQKQMPISQPVLETPSTVDKLVSAKEESGIIPHYASRGILLTHTEAPFFQLLRKMTKDYLVIFPHVALRDLVSVISDQSEYFTYYNKIDRKQVDFVLCDPSSLKPVFAIELDDSSHNRPDRKQRDGFVEDVLAQAKIPLVRVPVRNDYSVDELSNLFKGAVAKHIAQRAEEPLSQYTIDNPPLCSKHGVRMVLRTARRTGERFWGCPNYPLCREIIKLQSSVH
ncbi:MAG: hypothetical protein MHPDNHAH_03382 [Anaerolineales bacterium]|nr:hypothetical protein [Anaerolineales bacterium]